MKFFASIATACLLLSVVRADSNKPNYKPKIRVCDGDRSNDLFRIDSLSSTDAVAGQGVTLTVKGELKAEISDTAYIDFDATLGGFGVNQKFNLCKALGDNKCPVHAGSQTLNLHFDIPPIAAGATGVTIVGKAMKDASTVFFCIQGKTNVKPSSA
ncbi:hypothetical protein BGZ68_003318 [Mortierella alpina]|nr:hypothetical protein BGZ68_003318 [Mortierella alpina]